MSSLAYNFSPISFDFLPTPFFGERPQGLFMSSAGNLRGGPYALLWAFPMNLYPMIPTSSRAISQLIPPCPFEKRLRVFFKIRETR